MDAGGDNRQGITHRDLVKHIRGDRHTNRIKRFIRSRIEIQRYFTRRELNIAYQRGLLQHIPQLVIVEQIGHLGVTHHIDQVPTSFRRDDLGINSNCHISSVRFERGTHRGLKETTAFR